MQKPMAAIAPSNSRSASGNLTRDNDGMQRSRYGSTITMNTCSRSNNHDGLVAMMKMPMSSEPVQLALGAAKRRSDARAHAVTQARTLKPAIAMPVATAI